ncbi:MAG: hypothetical protein ACRBBN_09935 [Methyloligellaceae bacterium]
MKYYHWVAVFSLSVFCFCSEVSYGQTLIASRHQSVKIKLADAVLNVHFNPGNFDMPKHQILNWVSRSAEAVTAYYGRFPMKTIDIYILSVTGRGIQEGKAFGYGKPYIRIKLGAKSDWQMLVRDWVMVHEMIHLAFPKLDNRHDWLTEGLAVYVESIARYQAGHLSEESAWGSLFKGMPNGLPRYGDKGLDYTPTWGRRYWGGAMFCMVADLEIRRRTNGKKGLQHALRGILQAGGNYSDFWNITKALMLADKATGTTVLMDMYRDWRAKPVDPNLPVLWKRLGVDVKGRRAFIDNKAELADVRRMIGKKMP